MSAPSSEKSSNPISTAIVVIGASIALILGIALLAHFAVGAYSGRSLKGDSSMSDEAVAKRLKPVGELVVVDPNAPKVLKSGEQVFSAVCASCHAAGLAGAPKVGDKAGWTSRIAAGYDKLVKNAIDGIRAMPARGGNPDLDDIEVARAVVHMANASGANFKSPEPTKNAKPTAEPAATSPNTSPAAPSPAVAAPAVVDANKGKTVYEASCVACHGAGIAGAPKLGDKAAWAPRIKQGNNVLHDHAVKGFQGKVGMMPPKGGNVSLPDADVIAAVDYMVAQSK